MWNREGDARVSERRRAPDGSHLMVADNQHHPVGPVLKTITEKSLKGSVTEKSGGALTRDPRWGRNQETISELETAKLRT